jgi:hypothetical protein
MRVSDAPTPLPPVDAADVTVYSALDSLACSFERVAYIRTSPPVWGASRESIVRHAREKAGEVGANALVVRDRAEGGAFFSASGGSARDRSLAVFEQRPCS